MRHIFASPVCLKMVKNKRSLRRAAVILCVAALCLSLAGCGNDAEKTVKEFFAALNSGDYRQAGRLVGDENYYAAATEPDDGELTYYEKLDAELFIGTVFANVSVKLSGSEKQAGGIWLVYGTVSAYDTAEMDAFLQAETQKIMTGDDYLAADDTQKYVLLCRSLPDIYAAMTAALTEKETETAFTVKTDAGGAMYIVPGAELAKALSGGGTEE